MPTAHLLQRIWRRGQRRSAHCSRLKWGAGAFSRRSIGYLWACPRRSRHPSATPIFEVLPAGGSKGVGVAALLKHIGMPAELVLAMGDAENDLGMLELAGVSVAMGNAADEVKRVAQHVTAANDADGAALALEHHLLTARDRHAKGAEQEQEIVGSAPN